MSSNYVVFCLSHDPALIAFDASYRRPESAEQAIRQGINGHADCDLAIGRFSGGLSEVGCPVSRDQPAKLGCTHSSTEWTDREWLLLLAAAYQSADPAMPAAIKAGRHWCLPWERLRRLREELGFTITPTPEADSAGSTPDGPLLEWRQRQLNGVWSLEVPGGLVTVPGPTSRSQLRTIANCFWAPAAPTSEPGP